MKETCIRLEQLLHTGDAYMAKASESDLKRKPTPEKWSKKEILGHLIDSAINNLQRFTEIQFEDTPYKIRAYKQDELVKVNEYQNADTQEIIKLWLAINIRIGALIKQQTEKTLSFKIELNNGEISDLKFLMEDYVNHLEHHLNQIMN